MFGIKVKVETNTETMQDIKHAFKVSANALAEAYHKRKVREFEKSLHWLQDNDQGKNK